MLVSLGLYFYSVMGVIAARVAMSAIMFALSLMAARYLVGTRVAAEALNLWKVAAACASMALFVLTTRHYLTDRNLNVYIELGLTAALGAGVYVGTLLALGVRSKGYFEAVE